jgi:hypothetical protein
MKVCLENVPNAKEECEVYRESYFQWKSFLEEVLCIIGESFSHGMPFGSFLLSSSSKLRLYHKFYPLLHLCTANCFCFIVVY